MLGSYMEDIGITPEQFEAACGKASKNIRSRFHQVQILIYLMAQNNIIVIMYMKWKLTYLQVKRINY